MLCQRLLIATLLLLPVLPAWAAEGAPGRGLKEIPDPELNLMRGRYTVGGNNVAWFGVTMISQWQGANGSSVQGALTLGMDFRQGSTRRLTFQPHVQVTNADAPMPTPDGRSIDSSGQAVQVAGDGNTARNVTTLTVRDGAVPTTTDDGNRIAQMQQGGTSATAVLDGNQARLMLQIDGQGLVQQWIRNGSVGQGIALSGDGQVASNRLQLELVRSTVASNQPLSQSVAQAIALNRGMGPGQ